VQHLHRSAADTNCRLDPAAGRERTLARPVRLLAAGKAELGWDAFRVSYHLGPPLNTLFTPAAQAQYNTISRLLWALRRTERSLNDAWRMLKVRHAAGGGGGRHARQGWDR
jgi:hypothetical protein